MRVAFVLSSLTWYSLWIRCCSKGITNTSPFVPHHTSMHEGTSFEFAISQVRLRRHREVKQLAQGHRARILIQAVRPQNSHLKHFTAQQEHLPPWTLHSAS